jgi:hypothetical protein
MDIGPSEAETFWTTLLRKLARRGLRSVKLVLSDAHDGIKAAVSRIFTATWQGCGVHFVRSASAHAGRTGRRVVSAFRHSLRPERCQAGHGAVASNPEPVPTVASAQFTGVSKSATGRVAKPRQTVRPFGVALGAKVLNSLALCSPSRNRTRSVLRAILWVDRIYILQRAELPRCQRALRLHDVRFARDDCGDRYTSRGSCQAGPRQS